MYVCANKRYSIMTIKAYFKEVKSHYNFQSKRIIVSDESSSAFDHLTYVIIENQDTGEELYNLQFNSEHNCSVFRNAIVWNNLVVIGFDNYCYLFNLNKEEIDSYKLNSFFDSFFTTEKFVLVASLSNINCFNSDAEFLWRSDKLGTESIKIESVENDMIKGHAKWEDSGWKEFQLPLLTGGVTKKPKKKSKIASFFERIAV